MAVEVAVRVLVGALVVETFTREEGKSRADFPEAYCLPPGELRHAFPRLRVAVYRDRPEAEAASLLAFRAS
ncbi:MAG: hypothetical protein ACE5JI_09890 [Acidobacteriota bacterium]